MTKDEYAALITGLGFTNYGFCTMVGYNPRAGRNWKAGKPIPQGVQALLRLMAVRRLTAKDLRSALTRRLPVAATVTPDQTGETDAPTSQ